MTRTARKKTTKAKFLESSSWEELSSKETEASSGEQKLLKGVKSGRVKKKTVAKKYHSLCSQEDVVQDFVGQTKAMESHEYIEHGSNVKTGNNLKKQLFQKSHCKSKQEAHNLVSKNSMKKKLSSVDKRKQFRKRLEINKPALEASGKIDSTKKRKEREKRRLRRAKQKVCFNCREWGHQLEDCLQAKGDAGKCFRCGSSDHMARKCTEHVPKGQFPFAKCFVCGETGHLSHSCPDNPRGLYPKGGGCRLCGSVEHLRSNCPIQHKKSSLKQVTTRLQSGDHLSVDAESVDHTPSVTTTLPSLKTKRKPNTIKF